MRNNHRNSRRVSRGSFWNGLSCLSVHVDAEEVVKQERIIAFSPVVKKDQRVNLILNYRHAMDFPDDHLGACVIRLV